MQESVLNWHELREIAVASVSDPRTVRSYVEGRVVRHTTAVRISKALRDMGRDDLVRLQERRPRG